MLRLPLFGRKSTTGSKRGFLTRGSGTAPIAIDFGRRSVRMLQLAKGTSAYPCMAAAEIPGWVLAANDAPAGAGGDVTARLHDVISQCGFTGEVCAITLPAEVFQCDTARLPVMSDKELRQSIEFEATDRFGVEPDTTLLGHLRLGEAVGGQQDVLIMALPRAAVEAAVSPVSAAGMAALHLEHAALSALRAIVRQRIAEITDVSEATNLAMVHLEDRVATLVVVRDGTPLLIRSVLGDWAPMNTTIQRAAGGKPGQKLVTGKTTLGGVVASEGEAIPLESVEDEQAQQTQAAWRWCSLADETLRCMRHLERSLEGWGPKRLVITGPAACDPQVVCSMESVCGVQAELAVPIRIMDSAAPCVHGNPWVAAIGSALAGLPALKDATHAEAAAPQAQGEAA